MTFGEILKSLRVNKGATQAELAQYLGIAKSLVSMYERNQRKPSFEMLEAIADFFNVDMNTLYGDEPKGHYSDPIAAEYAEYLRTRPEGRVLFDASKDLTKEEMQETVNFIDYLKSKRK